MKTLTQVLERNDYVKLTESLKERVEEVAKHIRVKMSDLDLNELSDLELVGFRTNNGEAEMLYLHGRNLEYVNRNFYLHGDFHCRVIGAESKLALKFLNKAQEYISLLDEIESQQIKAIEDALAKTENLLPKTAIEK